MTDVAEAFVQVLAQLAPWLLLGFAAAGLLHAFVPGRWLARVIGGRGIGSIIRAALLGVPLPLCSCGVIPVAVELRKRGAGRGATTSFLVSTPETGVDSIAASFAVLHPLMALFRPLAAFVTAIVTGVAVERLSSDSGEVAGGSHCCHSDAKHEIDSDQKGLLGGMRYAFVDLFGEVGLYLLPAILITALLTTLIEPTAVTELVPSRGLQMVLLLLAGIPIYVCAAAATPVAAGLIVAGFSPGAALVFLLAGPATNLVTISAAVKTVGKAGAIIYTVTVGVVSLAFGVLLDLIFDHLETTTPAATTTTHDHIGWLQWASAIIVTALVIWHLWRRTQKGNAR